MGLPERPLGEVLRLALNEVGVQSESSYRIAGVYGFGRGLFQRGPISGAETSYLKLNRLSVGRLVMSRLKAFEGALSVIPADFDDWYLSPEFPTFDIDATQADTRYIANLCAWPELWSRLGAQSRGLGARKVRVSAARLMNVNVPLPDLPEQRRIAACLDVAFEKLLRVGELHARRAILLSAYKESLISDAIKSSEESLQVGRVLSLQRRQVFPESDRKYREVGIRSFGRGIFHKDPVAAEEIGDKRVFAIEPGDLVFSNVFAWEGAVALASEAESGMIGSHRFMTYAVNGAIADAAYLKHYFTSAPGLEVVRRSSPGSAGRNKTLGIKTFDKQQIQLPSLEIQRRIGRSLDMTASRLMVDDLKVLDALRLSVLNSAFTGQL